MVRHLNRLRRWFKEVWFLPVAVVFLSGGTSLSAWLRDDKPLFGFLAGMVVWSSAFAVGGLLTLIDDWAKKPPDSSPGPADPAVESMDADAVPRRRAW